MIIEWFNLDLSNCINEILIHLDFLPQARNENVQPFLYKFFHYIGFQSNFPAPETCFFIMPKFRYSLGTFLDLQ